MFEVVPLGEYEVRLSAWAAEKFSYGVDSYRTDELEYSQLDLLGDARALRVMIIDTPTRDLRLTEEREISRLAGPGTPVPLSVCETDLWLVQNGPTVGLATPLGHSGRSVFVVRGLNIKEDYAELAPTLMVQTFDSTTNTRIFECQASGESGFAEELTAALQEFLT